MVGSPISNRKFADMEETQRLRELSLRCTRLAQEITDPDMIIALVATAAESDAAADVLDAIPQKFVD
jgi:hypothetical protein